MFQFGEFSFGEIQSLHVLYAIKWFYYVQNTNYMFWYLIFDP